MGLRERLCLDAMELLDAFAMRGISDSERGRAGDPATYNGMATDSALPYCRLTSPIQATVKDVNPYNTGPCAEVMALHLADTLFAEWSEALGDVGKEPREGSPMAGVRVIWTLAAAVIVS